MRFFLCSTLAAGLFHATHGYPSDQQAVTPHHPGDIEVQDVLQLSFPPVFTDIQKHRLSQAFGDAMYLAHLALATIINKDKDQERELMFKKYFRVENKATVQAVFQSIVGSPNGNGFNGNDRLKNVGWDLADHKGWCGDPANPKAGDILMYTIPAIPSSPTDPSKPSKIIVCGGTWSLKFPDLQEIKCENACDDKMKGCYGSYRMANFGEFTLHELIHRTSLTSPKPANWKDQWINDLEIKMIGAAKPQYVYGSYYTQQFALSTRKEEAVFNADNYAMFAREAYFTKLCKKQLGYTPEPELDTRLPKPTVVPEPTPQVPKETSATSAVAPSFEL